LSCAILGPRAFSDGTVLSKAHIRALLLSLQVGDGSFRVCAGGEADTRSTYAAVTVACLCGLLSDRKLFPLVEHWPGDRQSDTLLTEEYILKCQTYEGGFSATPESVESHMAYCFCSVAALSILNGFDPQAVRERLTGESPHSLSSQHCPDPLTRLLKFVSSRQLDSEGGFSGRPNKLVDACYSFWVMGMLNLIVPSANRDVTHDQTREKELCLHFPVPVSTAELRRYLCKACQDEESGGLRDKPGAEPDLYHNAYGLLGYCLSLRLDLMAKESRCDDTGVLETIDVREIAPEFGVYRENAMAMMKYMQEQG